MLRPYKFVQVRSFCKFSLCCSLQLGVWFQRRPSLTPPVLTSCRRGNVSPSVFSSPAIAVRPDLRSVTRPFWQHVCGKNFGKNRSKKNRSLLDNRLVVPLRQKALVLLLGCWFSSVMCDLEVNHMSLLVFFFSVFYRFINARRRIVQPMIDQSNRAGKSPIVTVFKSHKRKPSSTSHAPGGPLAGKYVVV